MRRPGRTTRISNRDRAVFKPIRLLFLILAAFLAGLLFERNNTSEKCRTAGGTMDAGLCRNVP
ncbi:hypothetical protein RD1_1310 [Roseobacter denitrificans OCh 114]|uniref:Uncharacterized protein n=1 Tax=Roseobacter denitrificans (strain ATCC 33942 / OCh 114) TaxID=375451 RepID=Q16AN9_ROSDO|nr:hypothetical protein RD1_1310 [Roseobacter denitrificans OCh 114]